MDAVFHDDQRRHAPQAFLVNGVTRPNPETEARVDALLAALDEGGHAIVRPPEYGEATIAAVHSPEYLRFLRSAHARWSARGETGDLMPSVHPACRGERYPEDLTAPSRLSLGRYGLSRCRADLARGPRLRRHRGSRR